ncbi:nucleoside-diphosphate kinase [Streptomyces sp. NPDC096339]|uniref:nucleoside-diphosphate kinase n=1 Tax=Streptomyces sp. NPDC096339 TaxID=3366086 RepID=UPI0038047B10
MWGDPISTQDWSALTRIPAKRDFYARETYFREGLDDIGRAFGDHRHTAAGLRTSALLMLKPDGLAAGKLRPVLDYLDAQGFRVVAARTLHFTRYHWRELWRYQLTSATLDRLAVNDCLLLAGPALTLMLADTGTHELPATVRLSQLKGSATLEAQKPGTLRSLLGQPNRVLSYIHVADEPADLVRELGLLFEPAERRELIDGLVRGELSPAHRDVLDEALALYPPPGRRLSAQDAVERVTRGVRETPGTGPDEVRARAGLLDRLAAMERGERVEWLPFLHDLETLGIRPDRWDLAVLGTSFIVYDEPGQPKVLVNPDPETWKAASAR